MSERMMSKAVEQALVAKHQAEAAKFDAEALRYKTEAKQLEIALRDAAIDLRQKQRIEDELLALDSYNYTYRFNAPIDDATVKACIDKLTFWHRTRPEQQIEVVINSPGGNVFSGMDLFDYISELRTAGHKVITHGRGHMASMGGILLQAGTVRSMGRECPSPDEPVLMADLTWKPAGKLEPGDELLAADEDGHYRSWRKCTVTATGRAIRPCYEVRLADGTVSVVSENHRWLTKGTCRDRSWTLTSQLNKHGSGPSQVKRVMKPEEPLPSWEAGWMAGILDGEGCLYGRRGGQNLRIAITQAQGPVLDKIKQWFDAYGFRYYAHETKLTKEHHKPRESVVVLGGLEETLRLLSMTRPVRLLASLPESIDGMRLTGSWVPVESVTPVGDREVVSLATSTETFIGSGIVQHNSYILIHEVSTWAMGKVGEIEDEVVFLKKISERVVGIFTERAKQAGEAGTASHPITVAQLKRGWDRKDWWVDSTEALKLGIVDVVR